MLKLRLAKDVRGSYVNKVFAHWSAGHYGQMWDEYHICIDGDGGIFITCSALTELKYHTWHRNTGAIGVSMMCAADAEANNGSDCNLGDEPPTKERIEALAQVTAALAKGLDIEINKDNFMTHCEAAQKDDYGPGSGDPETRWDLWYLPDYCGDGSMVDGGDLWRGKANYYLNHMDD